MTSYSTRFPNDSALRQAEEELASKLGESNPRLGGRRPKMFFHQQKIHRHTQDIRSLPDPLEPTISDWDGGTSVSLHHDISQTDRIVPWIEQTENLMTSDGTNRSSEVLYFELQMEAYEDGVASELMDAIGELLVKHEDGFSHWSFGRCGLSEQELIRNRDSLKGTAFFEEGLQIPVWIGTVQGHRVSIYREINDGAFRMFLTIGGKSEGTEEVRSHLEAMLGCRFVLHAAGDTPDQARLRKARKRARNAPRLRDGRLP